MGVYRNRMPSFRPFGQVEISDNPGSSHEEGVISSSR